MRIGRTIAAVLTLGTIALRTADAQARPGTISGIVRDMTGRALQGATVVVDPGDFARRTDTDAAGRFRLTGVSRGAHILRTVKSGYQSDEQSIDLPAEGLDVTIALLRFTQLDTVPIRAARTGIFGTVFTRGDLHPLDGVNVDVVGAHASAKTPATGRFNFGAVKEGAYVVNVHRPGFQTRMLSVFVPHDGAIELAVAMDSARGITGFKQMSMVLSEFDERALRRGNRSTVIARQEFAGHYGINLKDALRYSQSFLRSGLIVVDSVVCVFVDGIAKAGATLNDFQAGEVEAVEIYGLYQDYSNTLMDRWPRNMPCGSGETSTPRSSHPFGLRSGQAGLAGSLGNPDQREPMDNRARAAVVWLRR